MPRPKDDGTGWTVWVQPVMTGYRMGCCDCGLVHTLDFRIVDGKVQFRARRNNRSTALLRHHMKKNEVED